MESDQLEKKVTWLDEQRRRDLDVLEEIDLRLQGLEEASESRDKRLEQLSDEIARLSTMAARISQFDDSLHKHRQEVSRQLGSWEERRDERAKNLEEIRKADQESFSTRLNQVRERVEELKALEAGLENRREEELRLTRELEEAGTRLTDLEDRFEDLFRSFASVEDGRKTDSKRVTELQSELAALRNRSESTQGVLDTVEDRLRRLETDVGELSTAESERRRSLDAWTENQSRKLVDFEREWNEWDDRFRAFEKQADELDDRMVQYEETYRSTRKLQTELEQVVERLERRINEITEMQRLAEERTKQEWTAFQADDQKRWNTYKLTNDEQWREHERTHKRIAENLSELRDDANTSMERIADLAAGIDRRIRSLLSLSRSWAEQLEE